MRDMIKKRGLRFLWKRERGGLYISIVRSFLVLIVIVVLMAVGMLSIERYLRSKVVIRPRADALLEHIPSFSEGVYDGVPTHKILGRKGYYEILDEEGGVLYTSDPDIQNSYSRAMLPYISDIREDSYFEMIPTEVEEDVPGYMLMYFLYNGSEKANIEDYLNGIALIDLDGRIIYTNLVLNGRPLTEKGLRILLDNTEIGPRGELSPLGEYGTILQKATFTGADGEVRYLLVHTESLTLQSSKIFFRIHLMLITIFIFLLTLAILLVGLSVTRQMKRPLRTLKNAMENFSKGGGEVTPDPRDPWELNQVIETFNQMESELKRSQERQRQAREQRRKMLADISHDLKTPITVIRGYVDVMKDGLIPREEYSKYLSIVSARTQHLAELINSFNEYSRLDHPDFRMNLEELDICEYLREYLADKYSELHEAGYELEVEIDDRVIMARLDSLQFKRALENIISNSVKYTPPGTCIRISLRETKTNIEIDIGDTGEGIPEEIKSTIFDPFVVGNEARSSGRGTGLGLSVSKKIIEEHGGEIRILSKEECRRGTWYRIGIPRSGGDGRGVRSGAGHPDEWGDG